MTVVLLVGAGHAHLYVVRHAAELVAAGYRVQLLAPRYFEYSGVASATAAGVLPPSAGRIDVRALAETCGVEFHEGTMASLDPERRLATTNNGAELSYDVLSLNIGSVSSLSGVRVHSSVLRVKPLSDLAELDGRLRDRPPSRATVTVVGAGASGLELASHLAARGDVSQVTLLEAGATIGLHLPPGAVRRVVSLLEARGVDIRLGCQVREVAEHRVSCTDGSVVPHDVALLATGLAAPPLLVSIGLGDGDGVPVEATLQHVDHGEIYAVGDCAHFLPGPLPRVGVHGVRQGPVLQQSLLARGRDESLPVYRPQRRALAILDLGDGVGLAVWGRWWWYGTTPLVLKRWIDRRWLKTYQAV